MRRRGLCSGYRTFSFVTGRTIGIRHDSNKYNGTNANKNFLVEKVYIWGIHYKSIKIMC